MISTVIVALLLIPTPAFSAQKTAGPDQDISCTTEKKGVRVDLTARKGSQLVRRCTPLILDVRTPREYRSGHIAGAKLVPLRELEKRIDELQSHRQKPVLIYCRTGQRSRLAASILIHSGYESVYHLDRGIVDWYRQGYPVKR